MAITLAESAVLSQNKLEKGIVEELIKESPLMGMMPFVDLVGNALAINREDADSMGSVAFQAVNGIWQESHATFEQVTFPLKVLGGDADVDNLIQKSRSNINDQMAAQIAVKTKLMAHEFEDALIYGVATGSNSFNGLHVLTASAQQVHAGSGTTGGALNLLLLDELIDKVKGGKPDVLIMSVEIRRYLTNYLRQVGSYTTSRDDYGNEWETWRGVKMYASDFLTQTEAISGGAYSAKTGGVTSSIFAVRFGEGDGFVGIQNGGITTEVFPKLETKDATRTRIKWYVGTALYSTLALARLDGVTAAAVTAAGS